MARRRGISASPSRRSIRIAAREVGARSTRSWSPPAAANSRACASRSRAAAKRPASASTRAARVSSRKASGRSPAGGRSARGALILSGLDLLEGDEVFHFPLRFVRQVVEVVDQRDVVGREALPGHTVEELADRDFEGGENAEQGVEADAVLALLHPRQVRLLDADARRELGLGEIAGLAQLPDLAADELHLADLLNRAQSSPDTPGAML